MASKSFFSKLFSNSVAGLDIGDQAVRYVVLERSDDGYQIADHGMQLLPDGVITDGVIEDPKRLSQILSQIRSKHDLHHVRVSLPASHSFIIENAGLVPVGHELRAHAQARALLPRTHTTTSMLVNVGDNQTDVSVVHGGKVYFATSFSRESRLTSKLAHELGVSEEEARAIQRSIGLSRRPEHEHVFAALVPEVSALAKKLDAIFIDWHTASDEKRPVVQEIVLAGANAHIAGFPEYLSAALRTKVVRGNPWININSLNHYIPPMHAHEALGYGAAIGLALGE